MLNLLVKSVGFFLKIKLKVACNETVSRLFSRPSSLRDSANTK